MLMAKAPVKCKGLDFHVWGVPKVLTQRAGRAPLAPAGAMLLVPGFVCSCMIATCLS